MALRDDPSLGPIVAMAVNRGACFEREMGEAGWREFGAARSAFWSAALAPGKLRVAWWSWRSQAPTMRCVPRGTTPGKVAGTLAVSTPEAMLGNGLLDRAEPLPPERRAKLLGLWSQSQAEDAPLRVPTGGGGLVSASLSFHDCGPLRRTPREWWPTARTVAEVLAGSFETGLYRVGDRLLAARVHAPATTGRMGPRGGDPRRGMAGAEIRLADLAASL